MTASPTWDERLFTVSVTADASGERVRVTVRRVDTGEERAAEVNADEFADEEYAEVVKRYRESLSAALGYVNPGMYLSEEFVFHHYLSRDENGGHYTHLVIEHLPSGRRSPFLGMTGLSGIERSRAKNQAMEDLIRALWEAGIPPQPLRKSIKRLGKSAPRRLMIWRR